MRVIPNAAPIGRPNHRPISDMNGKLEAAVTKETNPRLPVT